MGRARQVVIFLTLLLAMSFQGFCLDVVWEYEAEIDEKLEKLQIYFETEMHEEALEMLSELRAQFPSEPRFSYLQAIVEYQLGEYDQAEDKFIQFTNEYRDVPEPFYLLSEINLKKGNVEKARKYLARYCVLVPDDLDAQNKLNFIAVEKKVKSFIMQNGEEDKAIVKKLGFYGACVSSRENKAIKLINGSFRTWSCMGMDFTQPLDLRGKDIVLVVKGKKGGEKFELTFRDKYYRGDAPQLEIMREEGLADEWSEIVIKPTKHSSLIDLSSIVHIGLEFGFATVQNPAQSTLYVKDIIIKNAAN